ncbi:MAG: hypothetical protein QOD74_599, partial [Variibacter sp.]|nr:hypothetical protein [Variibacter sp.]
VIAVPVHPASADFLQQGPKLVGAGPTGQSLQGYDVAISADGSTAIIGGRTDNGSIGAAWVFIRSNGVWTQQGGKLLGLGAVGAARQGTSVALSADGNTAIVGGEEDNSAAGAAWVFVRNNGLWSAQGGKLVGSGAVNPARQGRAVALSGDGNTALVGGWGDNEFAGATWVFTRNGTTWTQQGPKLVGSGATGGSFTDQGISVALSGDGNTALIGGDEDNGLVGAAWVFNRNAGAWSQFGSKLVGTDAAPVTKLGSSVALSADGKTALIGGRANAGNVGAAWVFAFNGTAWIQQGGKLVGTGAVGSATQGQSVSLSGDGDTALVGGNGDANSIGATWVFSRSNGVWSQQGNKLVGTGAVGAAQQGASLALSADGSTAIVGGYVDSSSIGAAWVWLRRTPHDLSADGKSDIVWRNGTDVAAWTMQGGTVLSGGAVASVPTSWSIVGQRDFNGDRKADLLWRDSSGNTAIWFMSGGAVSSTASVGNVPPAWSIVGTGDLNGDGKGDLIWRDSVGNTAVWLMNGASVTGTGSLGSVPSPWSIAGNADFNGDGKADILWRNTGSGDTAIWFMNGTSVASTAFVATVGGTWSATATGDFDGDGKADLLWRDASGNTAIWLMNGAAVTSSAALGTIAGGWTVAGTGDFDGNGKADILWRNTTTGDTAIWFMKGTSVSGSAAVANVPPAWVVQATNAN